MTGTGAVQRNTARQCAAENPRAKSAVRALRSGFLVETLCWLVMRIGVIPALSALEISVVPRPAVGEERRS